MSSKASTDWGTASAIFWLFVLGVIYVVADIRATDAAIDRLEKRIQALEAAAPPVTGIKESA